MIPKLIGLLRSLLTVGLVVLLVFGAASTASATTEQELSA